ncbi:MAG TPA: hypothetical protein PLO78_01940 [Candidatus Omnitrophota bacterium]|nr:hypothetical protein [Candidatus Omnitrophota bacterium]
MNVAHLLGSFIFGVIGFAVFIYGKKQSSFKALVIGLILMVYPYLIANTIAVYAIGAALVLAFFIIPGSS